MVRRITDIFISVFVVMIVVYIIKKGAEKINIPIVNEVAESVA